MLKSRSKKDGEVDKSIDQPKTVRNTADKSGEAKKPWYKHSIVFGILGLALFLVFVSIAYSVVVIWMGTKGPVPRIMTAPMIAFDMLLAGVAFSKIFK